MNIITINGSIYAADTIRSIVHIDDEDGTIQVNFRDMDEEASDEYVCDSNQEAQAVIDEAARVLLQTPQPNLK